MSCIEDVDPRKLDYPLTYNKSEIIFVQLIYLAEELLGNIWTI